MSALDRIYEILCTGLLDLKSGAAAEARNKLEEILSLSAAAGEKEKGHYRQAVNLLRREILFAEGSYDEALKVFQEEPPIEVNLIMSVTVQQKNLPLVNDFAARVLREKGETDKAVAEYECLVSPDPNARQKALVHPFNRHPAGRAL